MRGRFHRLSFESAGGRSAIGTACAGSWLEALGGEQFEAEGFGEPVGRVERGADGQCVLDLLV